MILSLLAILPTADAGLAPLAPAQEASLAAGEVLLLDHTPSHAGGVSVEGIADVAASADAVWAALLDFQARLKGNSSVKSFAYYRTSTPTEEWGVWEVSHFGFSVTYHNHYLLDRADGSLIHELDASQPNDLTWSRGVYTLGTSPNNPQWQRLSYVVDTDFGAAIPGFIKSWLCGQGVKDYLVDLVHRAEGA